MSRLVPYKKTKLIVEAFNKMPDKKLVVIGMGEEYNKIKNIAKSNIEILGYQDDEIAIKYMQKAKAFVYAAIEDFGIVPIEALACGTPVIALNKGGTAETIINGLNGIHFENQTTQDIQNAVKKFEKTTFDLEKVVKTALKYINFKENLKNFIDKKI
jgi:glycosyltransferase involved in cell wall biosynthesis